MSDPPPARSLSDAALARLRVAVDEPDLAGTRYELCEPLGRGGMGTVWRAHDRTLARDVALKVLHAPAADELARRMVQEAGVLARLEHPGIVPVHDVGTLPDGRVFYAMKLVRGRRLDLLVQAGLTEAEKLRIFARMGEAVAFAHAAGVIHRDLKPGNIMVGAFGEVLVLDWGLAKVRRPPPAVAAEPAATAVPARTSVEMPGSGSEPLALARGADAATRYGTRIGTPGFMAPEQANGDPADLDERADVYALGVVLAYLGSPGDGAGRARAPRALAAIAAKAVAPARERRYASVVELLADVARYQAGEAVAALPEGVLLKTGRLYRKYRAAVWLIGTYALLRVAFELLRQHFGRGAV